MKHLTYIVLLTGIISMVVACGSTRNIKTAIAKKDTTQLVVVKDGHADSMQFIRDVYAGIRNNTIDFTTFSAKVKMDYWDKDGKGPDLTVFIRIQKDSVIWVSVNATVFSYEAFRVLITPDSVKLLNKKDKEVLYRSVSYLQEISHLPFTFRALQDVIIGNPVNLDSNIVSYKKDANTITLLSMNELFKNLLTVAADTKLLLHAKLDDKDVLQNRTCVLTYGDYENNGSFHFSKFRKISLAEKTRLDVQMDFKQYGFNETLNYPFNVPKNYKVQ